MKKISILGILAIISTSAMAETVPSNGVMSNDTTYDKSCNNTTLGTYTGPANMTAQYTANTYNCPAGQYLVVGDANTEPKCETCPAGSYCPGTNDVEYTDEMTDTGLSACPSGYANSDAGATSDAGCYTACVKSQVSHATSVSGKSYKNGTNTCVPTGCEAGYGMAGLKSVLSELGNKGAGLNEHDTDGDGIPDSEDDDDDNDGIPDDDDDDINGDGKANNWYWSNEIISFGGTSLCSTRSEVIGTTHDNIIDETGMTGANYCYCNIETVNGHVVTSGWVAKNISEYQTCSYSSCASACVNMTIMKTLLDSIEMVEDVNVCKANTIDLKWDGVTDAGDAATCSFGGDLKTPATAPTRKGYKFVGWKVNK